MASIVQIQLRRDTLANWTANNPVLASGEPAYETDTNKIKYGNGVNNYNDLPYFESDKHYTHSQGTASAIWNINHNLGKEPSITVTDSAGTEVEGDVQIIDLNNVTLCFTAPFAGKAHLN